VNIIMRQFGAGISWYMESAQYLNIWTVLIATVGICATNEHLRIDAMERIFKGTPKRILRLVIALLTIVFLVTLGYSFLLLASRSRQTVSTMPFLKMAVIYWPIPILCFLSAISSLLHTIWDFTNFGKEKNI
ncbi:MAG: TRAP transporter small permease, partial [Treponema sp.]|nr:TRAP transporter small permease [Treponema sp.]